MIGLFIVELDWRRAAQSASLQENIDLTEDSGFYQKKKKKKGGWMWESERDTVASSEAVCFSHAPQRLRAANISLYILRIKGARCRVSCQEASNKLLRVFFQHTRPVSQMALSHPEHSRHSSCV